MEAIENVRQEGEQRLFLVRFYDQAVTPRVSVTVSLMQEMASYLNRPAKAPVTDYTIAGASHGPVVIMIYKAGQKQANK